MAVPHSKQSTICKCSCKVSFPRIAALHIHRDQLPILTAPSKRTTLRPSGPSPATATRALGYRPSTPLSRRTARALHTCIAIRKAMRCAARRRVGTNGRSVTLSVEHDETVYVRTGAMIKSTISIDETASVITGAMVCNNKKYNLYRRSNFCNHKCDGVR